MRRTAKLYWSKVYSEVVNFFKDKGVPVFVIGVRASFLADRNIPLYRLTKDFDIYVSLSTNVLHSAITKQFRSRSFNVQWRSWGLRLKKDGDIIDVSTTPARVNVKRVIKIEEGVYVPSLEDQIILKLIAGRKRDRSDVKKYIQHASRLDVDYLLKQAKLAGIYKKVVYYLKIMKRLRGEQGAKV